MTYDLNGVKLTQTSK